MTGGGGCCVRRRTKIGPAPGTESEYHVIEIRPKRRLRIRHINPVPRDEKFEKEMETQLAYRRKGYPSSLVSSGVMMMPKKHVVSDKPQGPHSDMLPNTINFHTDHLITPITENGNVSKESTFSCTTPNNINDTHSASGVMIAMDRHPQGQGQANSKVQGHMVPNGHALENGGPRANEVGDDRSHCSSSVKTDCVLFFIHGVGGSSDIWIPQLEYFANEGYEIVAPDLIGHGFSDTPTNAKAYHFDEILADAEEIFDRYCKRKNVIIGHSYGCSFAAVLGRRRTRRVHKLVLISGGGPTPLNPQTGVFSIPVCVLGCVRPCVECSFKKSAFSKKPVIPPGEAFSIPTYVLRHTMNGQIWPDGDELYHNWLMCPTLLIYGLHDQLVSLEEEKYMEEAIYQSRLVVIEDASHMVMIETPNKVNKLIIDFLNQTSHFADETSPAHEARVSSRLSQISVKSVHASGSATTKSMR